MDARAPPLKHESKSLRAGSISVMGNWDASSVAETSGSSVRTQAVHGGEVFLSARQGESNEEASSLNVQAAVAPQDGDITIASSGDSVHSDIVRCALANLREVL